MCEIAHSARRVKSQTMRSRGGFSHDHFCEATRNSRRDYLNGRGGNFDRAGLCWRDITAGAAQGGGPGDAYAER